MLDTNEILSFLQGPLKQFPDRSAKWLLSNTDNLQGLLEIIGNDLVESLDFSKVQRINTTFIADNLREQESDIVFLLPFRDAEETEVMIYILLEHQSTVDPVMGFRLLFYMCQIWDQQRQQWVAEEVPKHQWRFRPIIPVLFYTGKQRWQTPLALERLMDVPEPLTRFIPKFETLFLGVQSEPDARLLQTGHPFGWLMTVLKHEDSDADVFARVLGELGGHLGRLTEAERASWKQAIYYLYLFIFHRRSVEERQTLDQIVSEHHETLGLSEQEEHLMQSMAEHYLEQGAREMSIESTLAILKTRFPDADINALKSKLETITDLDLLKALNLNASIAHSNEAFQERLRETR